MSGINTEKHVTTDKHICIFRPCGSRLKRVSFETSMYIIAQATRMIAWAVISGSA